MGGAFAFPYLNRYLSGIFQPGTIWETYPVLLPNLVSAAVVLVGLVIGILFLDETHPAKKLQRDRGRELGDRLAAVFYKAQTCHGRNPEKQSLLGGEEWESYDATTAPNRVDIFADADEALPIYRSQENSPKLSPRNPVDDVARTAETELQPPMKPKVFTKSVILNIICYGILAL